MRPAAYPEVISGHLRPLGCNALKSARHFPFIGSKDRAKIAGLPAAPGRPRQSTRSAAIRMSQWAARASLYR
jgi:hypothetical protein